MSVKNTPSTPYRTDIIPSQNGGESFSNSVNAVLSSETTLDTLFFGNNQDRIPVEIFGKEHRVGLKGILEKNPFVAQEIDMYGEITTPYNWVNHILHNPLIDSKIISQRQLFFSYLIQNSVIDPIKQISEHVKYNMNSSQLQKRDKRTGENLFKKYLTQTSYDFIISEFNKFVSGEETEFQYGEGRKILMIYFFIEGIKGTIVALKKYCGDNQLLVNQALLLEKKLIEFGFERDIGEVIIQLQGDELYFGKVLSGIHNFTQEYNKLIAVISLAGFIRDFGMKEVTFDENKPYSYTNGYSVFETRENNVVADSIDDNQPLTIFRAPNGSGKTFFIEKDIYIHILAQTTGFTTATDANLRLYTGFYYLNRMQSQSDEGEDLSALGIEGKKLDRLYGIIKQSSGDIMINLDETGSTTDEKNEFIIMRNFLEACETLSGADKRVTIRFSTHNQLLVDYFKKRNKKTNFCTFDDSKNLKEGERDSDTLNTFRRLMTKLQDVKESLRNTKNDGRRSVSYPIQDDDFGFHSVDEIMKQLFQVLCPNGYGAERKKKVSIMLENLEYFLCLGGELEQLIDDFLHGKVKVFEAPTKHHTNIPLRLDKKTLVHLANAEYSPMLYFSTGSLKTCWKAIQKNIAQRGWRRRNLNPVKKHMIIGRFFRDDDIEGSRNHRETIDYYKSFREPYSKILETQSIGYSNISHLGDFNVSRIRKGRHFTGEECNKMFPGNERVFQYLIRGGIAEIPLVQLRQDILTSFIVSPESSQEIIKKIDKVSRFLIMAYMIFSEFCYEKKIVKKSVWDGDKDIMDFTKKTNLAKKLLKDMVIQYDWGQRKQSSLIAYLKNKNESYHERTFTIPKVFSYIEMFCKFTKIPIEEVFPKGIIEKVTRYKTLFPIVPKDILDTLGMLERRNIGNIDTFDIPQEQKDALKEVVTIERELKPLFLRVFTKILPEKIKNVHITLDDIVSRKYVIACEQEFWMSDNYIENNFMVLKEFQNSLHTGNVGSGFFEACNTSNHLIIRSMGRHYHKILKMLLGQIGNSHDIMEYRDFHVQNYVGTGVSLGDTFGENTEGEYVNIENPNAPHLMSFYYPNGALRVGRYIWNMSSIIQLAQYLQKKGFAKVRFLSEKKLVIRGMKSSNHDNEKYISNDVFLSAENPIELVNGFNASGKTEYIRNIVETIDQALNTGFVNAKSMELGGIQDYCYIDRIVTGSQDFSSGEQDIIHWMMLFERVKNKDLVIINVDEIFSTMDKKYAKAFAYNFVGKLMEMGKLAIIISHNHDFISLFSQLKGVTTSRFNSSISVTGEVSHSFKKEPGEIKDSAGAFVLRTLGYGNGWLYH